MYHCTCLVTCLHANSFFICSNHSDNLSFLEPGDYDTLVFTITVLTANFHSSSVIHSHAIKVVFYHYKSLCRTDTEQSLPMLRDLSGHSSTVHSSCLTVVCNWERSGWIHMFVQVVSRVAVLVPLPDNNTAAPCVSNSARCRPVQLTTQAGSAPRHVLLISFSIQVICTSLCTSCVHKKVQSSIVHTSKVTYFWCFCLWSNFSVHFSGAECSQTDWKQFLICSSGILSRTQKRETSYN